MGPKAIARAAHWADGVDGAWTMDGDRDAMATAFTQIRDAWDGRRPHRGAAPLVEHLVRARRRRRSAAARRTRTRYMKIMGDGVGDWAASAVTCFTPDALRRAVDNARDAGADEFFLVPTTSDPDELARTRDALGI